MRGIRRWLACRRCKDWFWVYVCGMAAVIAVIFWLTFTEGTEAQPKKPAQPQEQRAETSGSTSGAALNDQNEADRNQQNGQHIPNRWERFTFAGELSLDAATIFGFAVGLWTLCQISRQGDLMKQQLDLTYAKERARLVVIPKTVELSLKDAGIWDVLFRIDHHGGSAAWAVEADIYASLYPPGTDVTFTRQQPMTLPKEIRSNIDDKPIALLWLDANDFTKFEERQLLLQIKGEIRYHDLLGNPRFVRLRMEYTPYDWTDSTTQKRGGYWTKKGDPEENSSN